MDFQKVSEALAHIPVEYRETHKYSSHHRQAIENSKQVSCFYCLGVYPPSEIKDWIDGGQTAICPHCEIDAVLPDSVPSEKTFLKEMRKYWFES